MRIVTKRRSDFKDLTGQRFGKLVVLSWHDQPNKNKHRWHCRCDCGREVRFEGNRLRNGKSVYCGSISCRPSKIRFESTRICAQCQVAKPHEDFYILKKSGKIPSYCKPCHLERQGTSYRAHLEHRKAKSRAYARGVKKEVVDAYGGRCTCCGEATLDFLCIDHVHGDGAKHRAANGINGGGTMMYNFLKRNGYPAGFQVLCNNCNWAKFATRGNCPHNEPSWMPPTYGGFVCVANGPVI